MNMRAILNQISSGSADKSPQSNGIGGTLEKITSQLPGGLAGGAVAGGIMSLIMSNKSARKVAGTAATYGGAALLGGLAYKAYNNWQSSKQEQMPISEQSFSAPEMLSSHYQLALIKAMIGAAKADGQIDADEHNRIFSSIDEMSLSMENKALVLDLIRQPISIEEISQSAVTMEQKTELYLVSCMVSDPDHPAETQWLSNLAGALELPQDLAMQLQLQAKQHLMAA